MQSIAALAALLPLVAAHGFVQDPPAREPGDAYKAACGEQPYYQQTSDINGNVQGILQVVGSDFDASKCNLWLCKGFLLADNPDNVQSYTAGQVVDFTVNIAAPHTGIANVSVVSTSTNTIIGEPLIEFENYAANAGVAANNTAFSVTIPSDLGSSCTTAGDCVLQWFWDAEGINQTYESCIDFTVGGSSSGGDSGSASSAVVSSAAATEAAATTAAAATSAAAVTEPAVVTSAITPVAPVSTDAAAVTSEAPAATSAAADDEECPADEDEGDDEGDDDEEGDDEDCSDEGDDEGDNEDEGDDEDCDLDGEETDIETAGASATDVAAVAISSTSTSAAATTTAAAVQTGSGSQYGSGSGSGSNNGAGSATKPAVTSYITVTGKPHTRTQVQTKYVTITAEAAACT